MASQVSKTSLILTATVVRVALDIKLLKSLVLFLKHSKYKRPHFVV